MHFKLYTVHSESCTQALDLNIEKLNSQLCISVTQQDFSQNKKQKNKKNSRGGFEEQQPIKIEEQNVDPNEPLYCICRRVYFGRMIGCENNDCKYEWFHFDCIGLTEEPDPDIPWYCKECLSLMNGQGLTQSLDMVQEQGDKENNMDLAEIAAENEANA